MRNFAIAGFSMDSGGAVDPKLFGHLHEVGDSANTAQTNAISNKPQLCLWWSMYDFRMFLDEIASVNTILRYTGWWLTYPSEKYESQLGWWFTIYGNIKNVPNHEPVSLSPVMKQTCQVIRSFWEYVIYVAWYPGTSWNRVHHWNL